MKKSVNSFPENVEFKPWQISILEEVQIHTERKIILVVEKSCGEGKHGFRIILSQPNNNHNPNNKATKTVVGLRLSNHWEPPPPPPTHPPHKLKTI